ncbi:MAG: M48 family metallopeptidase [Pseudomonadota bacterium]
MLDFFERQESARRNTFLLLFLFFLAVVMLVAIVHWSVTLFLLFTPRYAMTAQSFHSLLIDPDIYLVTIPSVLLLIFIGNAYKFFTLRRGGSEIALRLGGRLILPDTFVQREQRLLHVVEEMALASGLPVPLVYVLDRESGINAFAAGFTPADAVITVTDGALDLLNRDELQGVVAHEFSHIANGDMLLNIRLIGIVHGILLLHLAGAVILRGFERNLFDKRRQNGAAIAAVGFLLYVLGFIGGLLAKLIKMAVARQREYLSDASAVQFTRNPLGLASALKKIGGLTLGSNLRHPLAEEMSHMFFGNAIGDSFFDIFSTHPPLAGRILLLDPAFDGTFPKIKRIVDEIPVGVKQSRQPLSDMTPAAATSERVFPAGYQGENKTQNQPDANIFADEVIERYMRERRKILHMMPVMVRQACRDHYGAQAVVLNLLFSPEEGIRTEQWQLVRNLTDRKLIRETERLFPPLSSISRSSRLPLVDLALPALRLMAESQYQEFRKIEQQLIYADKKIDLFEYMLHLILVSNLEQNFAATLTRPERKQPQDDFARACSVLFTLLAKQSYSEEKEARTAFNRAVSRIQTGKGVSFVFPADTGPHPLKHFDRALTTLAGTALTRRKNLLAACLECITGDGQITPDEAELLRAIGAGLHCPIPPELVAC